MKENSVNKDGKVPVIALWKRDGKDFLMGSIDKEIIARVRAVSPELADELSRKVILFWEKDKSKETAPDAKGYLLPPRDDF